MRAIVAGLLAVAATAVSDPRPASACSHPAIDGVPYLAFPASEATQVPTNVVIGVAQATWTAPAPSEWQLRDPDGAVQSLTLTDVVTWGSGDLPTTSFRLSPAAALGVGSRYELIRVVGTEVTLVGAFTTASIPDSEAPATPVADEVTVGPNHSCESDFRCCAVHPRVIDVEISLAPVAEPVAYTLRDGNTVLAADLAAPLVGLLLCDEYFPSFRESPGPGMPSEWLADGQGPHALELVARDLAGNESAALPIDIAGDCSNLDEGLGELPPANDGCRLQAPAAAAWVPIAGVVALALGRRRRRCHG